MIYLTAQHTRPPSHIIDGGKRIPIAPLIARQDNARLAQYGIYSHHRNTEPAPLGTEWVLIDGEYHESPLGTPEEIQAALAAQEQAAHEAYLDALECTRLQGKLALIQADVWDQYQLLVETLLPTMTASQRVFVEDAQTWRYRDPVLQAFVAAMAMTDQQVIDLFNLARTL